MIPRSPLALVCASLALVWGAVPARAQSSADDFDAGPGSAPAAIRALWRSAPIIDVDPDEPGSSSAGLQEALARCNGGAGGCVLQLRADTTYTLPPHTTWSLPLGGTQPRIAFHTDGADDVWLRGHGDGSVIAYTQVGSGDDRLIRNKLITADNGSDRVLFSDFRIVRSDECSVDCRQYAMVFSMHGDVSDVVIDDVTVQSTQQIHDGAYAGRNVFLVEPIAYPEPTPATTPRRVVVRNSRFSMSSSGIHTLHCDDCRFVANRFDAAGVPHDDNGATVRAFTIFKGRSYLVANNAIDLAMDGRTTQNWSGCILLQGDQTLDPNEPQSRRINEGATVIGNLCTGLRQPSASGIRFQGYRHATVTGNRFYTGRCSNDALVSCRRREDCGADPGLHCDPAPAKAFYFEDMEWPDADSNQANALRSNRFGHGTDCAVRMDSWSDVDPDSNTGNAWVGNAFRLGSVANRGFCGSGPGKWPQNTFTRNRLIEDAASAGGEIRLGEKRSRRADGAWLLSDSRCDDPTLNALPIESSAVVQIAGGFQRLEGSVSGFGTGRDYVRIEYGTDLPDGASASGASAKLGQRAWSRLCVYLDDPEADDGGRDTLVDGVNQPICRFVERCSVSASVTPGTPARTTAGAASARCSGADLFSDLSSEQIESLRTAFPAGNACGISVDTRSAGRGPSIAIALSQRASGRSAR